MKFIFPKFNLKIEKWKWNKEYRVYVSTLGHIKNERKENLPIKINDYGYCAIKTSIGVIKAVHRLVMLTWRPIPNAEDLTIDHLNHNKRDNSLENLEWITKEENEQRAVNDFIRIYKQIANFNTISDAVNWTLKTQGALSQKSTTKPNRQNIENKIYDAIKNKTVYCGYIWTLENNLIKVKGR